MKSQPLALKQIARLTKVKPGRPRLAGAALANPLLRFFVTKLKPVPTKVNLKQDSARLTQEAVADFNNNRESNL